MSEEEIEDHSVILANAIEKVREEFDINKYPFIKENFVKDPTLRERLSRNTASILKTNLVLFEVELKDMEDDESAKALTDVSLDAAMLIEETIYARLELFKK
jgi:hypothetical protein